MSTNLNLTVQNLIRIVAHLDSPLANECFDTYPNDVCLFPGYEIEYIYTVIHDMLRYTVEFIKVDNDIQIEAALDEHRADIMGLSSFVNTRYSLRFGFPPEAFMYDSLALLVRESYTNKSQVLSLLNSFTWDLWSFIMVTSVVCLGLRYVSKIFHRNTSTLIFIQNFILKTIKVILFKFRANVMFSIWFILVSLLLNFYSNLIAVDLVAPDHVKTIPFKTLPELGKKLINQECKFVLLDSYYNLSEIRDLVINPVKSNRPWAPQFVEAYKTNPPWVAKDRNEMVAMILNSSLCLVGLDFATMDLYYQTNFCNLRVLSYPDEIKMLAYTFYTTRAGLSEAVSKVISSESFQGYTSYLNDKYYRGTVIPVDCNSDKNIEVKPVNLKKIQDCFFLLAIGLVISFFIMLVRNGIYSYKNRKTLGILKCTNVNIQSSVNEDIYALHISPTEAVSM